MGGNNNNNNKNDFYEVLDLKKECSEAELKNAYKKLALKWHPDRCSASGNFKYVEESKKKFQAIQEAYSVLSDVDKRFLYDVGVYDTDDDDNEGMADFMSEMAVMMSQNKPNGNGESFEELRDLFEEMFESDIDDSFGSTSQSQTRSSNCYSSTSSFSSCCEGSSSSTTTSSNKRASSAISNSTKIDQDFQGFSSRGRYEERSGIRRKGRHA